MALRRKQSSQPPAVPVSVTTVLVLLLAALPLQGGSDGIYAAVRVVASPDRDGDGLTDASEAWLGTHPERADTDNDGMGDRDELIAGTCPTNRADVFRLRFDPAWGTLEDERVPAVVWPSEQGRLYSVLAATNTGEDAWSIVPGYEQLPGTGHDMACTNGAAARVRLFRVHVEQDR